jgi:hypothetical protein
MPRGIEGHFIESTQNKYKFELGQIINRYGKRFRITAINWNRANQVWDIYGVEVYD